MAAVFLINAYHSEMPERSSEPIPLNYRNREDDRQAPSYLKAKFDLILRTVASVVAGTLIGACCSMVLWEILGGWQRPELFLFSFIGFLGGLTRANEISRRR
jgi:hypothetical protein